jgi:hypothetical protein
MMKCRRGLKLLVWVSLAAGFSPVRAAEVSEAALMSHVRFIASELFEGRLAGQNGDVLAERYIQALYEQTGLQPLPALDDFRQGFTINETSLDRDKTYLGLKAKGKTTFFKLDREVFYLVQRTSDITISAPVVFAGFGITAPEYDYDDYAGIDVEGKIVLILSGEPGGPDRSDKFRGRAPTRHSFARAKEAAARSHGAAGVVLVTAGEGPDYDQSLPRRYAREMAQPYFSLEGEEAKIPVFYATRPVARAILEGSGIDPNQRRDNINQQIKPASSAVTGKEVVLNVRLASVTGKSVANVIGYLEGSDPALKEEFIVVAAHHDHLGRGAGGEVYYGADDNASGVAGLLEIARIFGTGGDRLSRSLLFVSFCAEEQGLLGDKYFADHLPIPREAVRVLINLDMIGRNNMDKAENGNMFIVFTSAQTPALEKIVRSEAKALDQDVRVAPYVRFHGNSDHIVFHDQRVPVIYYFSGFHSDYSRPTDTTDRIIPSKIVKVVEHLYRLVTVLAADGEIDLDFDNTITVEPEKDEFENPYARPRAGKTDGKPAQGH